jgi:STE24 endopeptidase
MPFLLLLVLTPPCLQEVWPEPTFGVHSPVRAALLTWASVVFAIGVSAFLAWQTRRRLTQDPGHRDVILQRYGKWRMRHLFGLFLIYGVSLYGFGWGWAVQNLCTVVPDSPLPPGSELLILAPFLVALLGSWLCFYDIERTLHDTILVSDPAGPTHAAAVPFWSRWQYLTFQVRNNLALVLIPIGVLIAVKAVHWLFPGITRPEWRLPTSLLAVAGAACLFICMPWLLRLIYGLKPLPAGPLRERLLALARRLNFRCSDILVWNTRGGSVNALVAGILPMPRYVVLTDRLTTDLTPEEVEAVFGHEVGHVKHRHMLYYLGFLMASLTVGWAAIAVFLLPLLRLLPEQLAWMGDWQALANRDDLAMLVPVGLLAFYLFVVFGFVSRRCERQADLYGCRAVSCDNPVCSGHDATTVFPPGATGLCPTGIRIFINALEKVGYLNGINRDRPGWLQSWQHSTIGRRVEFLQGVIVDPAAEPRFQRGTAVVKWALLLSLAVLLLALGSVYGWDKLQL